MWAQIFNFSVEPKFSSEGSSESKKNKFLFKFSTQPYTTLVFKSALTLTGVLNKLLFLEITVFYGSESIFVQF